VAEELTTFGLAVGAGSYAAAKLFGPTLDQIGTSLGEAYKKGVTKIVEKATKKIGDPNDGKKPNLRLARDVIWNGGITDEEVCAEYFGGILAAGRSVDGKDDSLLNYVDTIKALSAKQLQFHYAIYHSLQVRFHNAGNLTRVNVASTNEVAKLRVVFSKAQLHKLGLDCGRDLPVLYRAGLIGTYTFDNATIQHEGRIAYIPYAQIAPDIYGFMLYAAAFNKLDMVGTFSTSFYGVMENVELPEMAVDSVEALCEAFGVEFVKLKAWNPPCVWN